MIVYHAEKTQFLLDCNDHDIEDVIHAKYQAATNHKVSASEVNSCRESLGYMARVLCDPEIPEDSCLPSAPAGFAARQSVSPSG